MGLQPSWRHVRPWCKDCSELGWTTQGQGTICFGFTAGLGTWSVGPIDMGQVTSGASGPSLVADTGALHERVSFVALTFAFEGRPARPADAEPADR